MRNANKIVALALSLAAVAACQKNGADQNLAMANNAAAPTDIEALPPDESSETSSNELVDGQDNADVADLNASSSND
jgi:hypothetical protein